MEAERRIPRVLPPHYFVLALLCVCAVAYFDRSAPLPDPWPLIGLLPLVIGVIVSVRGSRQFAEVGTNIIPLTRSSTLVTSGVFAYSRNPMYLGMLLALVGVVLLGNSLWAAAVPVVFFGIIRQRFVLKEEPLMLETFGGEYEAYMSRVRRWF